MNNLLCTRDDLHRLDPLVFCDVDLGIHNPVRENTCRWHKKWLRHRDDHVRLAKGPSILDGRQWLWSLCDISKCAGSVQPCQKRIFVSWLEGAIVDPWRLGRSNGRSSLPRRHGSLLNGLLNHRCMRLDIGDGVQLEWGNTPLAVTAHTVLLNNRRNCIVVRDCRCRRSRYWFKRAATWVDICRCRLFAGNNSPESAQQPLVTRFRERARDGVLVISCAPVHQLLICIEDKDFSRCTRRKHTGDGFVCIDDVAAVQSGGC